MSSSASSSGGRSNNERRSMKRGRNFAESSPSSSSSSTTSSSSTAATLGSAMSIDEIKTVKIQFVTPNGESTGPPLSVPTDVTHDHLQTLVHQYLSSSSSEASDSFFAFYFADEEIVGALSDHLIALQTAIAEKSKRVKESSGDSSSSAFNFEDTLSIVYRPQSLFRVRSVTRCSSSLPGHSEAILVVSFSPDSTMLATGSGDCTVRLWDVQTATPSAVLRGHKNWVLCCEWAPNGRWLASGGNDGEVRVWDTWGKDSDGHGRAWGKALKGHKKWITSLSWEPLHANGACNRLASASKDGDIRIWDISRSTLLSVLSGHSHAVTSVRWGGLGAIYSASQDRTIKVWNATKCNLIRSLQGHAHWVNHLALNTDSVLRCGAFDLTKKTKDWPAVDDIKRMSADEQKKLAEQRWTAVLGQLGGEELVASASDDFTLMLWNPLKSAKPMQRLTGHQQLINHVAFSPDGAMIASASFDKSVRLWNGKTGGYIAVFRAHVQSVYHVCWSADSRLLVSSSKDSTMKVWDISSKKMKFDLPGHADEVYACDWSADGEAVASGGKDQVVKLWKH